MPAQMRLGGFEIAATRRVEVRQKMCAENVFQPFDVFELALRGSFAFAEDALAGVRAEHRGSDALRLRRAARLRDALEERARVRGGSERVRSGPAAAVARDKDETRKTLAELRRRNF